MTSDQSHIPLWEIPELVIQNHLLPLLGLNDLFRLRRVCTATKHLAEDYIRQQYKNKLPEIEISEEPDSFWSLSSFLTLDLPFNRVYLNNTDVKFFSDPHISSFIEKYSAGLTHMRVRNFFGLSDRNESKFFDAFTNLIHLELEQIDASEWRCDYDRGAKKFGRTSCPVASCFSNLKSIKFGRIIPAHNRDHGYWEDIVYCCYRHWEYIGHPGYDHPRPPNFISHGVPIPARLNYPVRPVPEFRNSGSFLCIQQLIEHRHKNYKDEPNLRYYDMGNMNESEVESAFCMDFILLVQLCYDHGVKLLNVNAGLFQLVGPGQEEFFKAMVIPLISLKNVEKSLFLHELPSLEKVVITATSKCSFLPLWGDQRKPEWPKLKILDMTVNSADLKPHSGNRVKLADLYHFLFKEVVRQEMREFALRFEDGSGFPSPKTKDIKASCPFLTKLTLENFSGTNKALSLFWEGMTTLEELVLKDCKELGNVGFVGENKERPVFFQLKRLKVLTLGGLERMPKITDTIFELVLRHMKLAKLFLTSREPLKTVTSRGINSLLSGEFASTIEKFPFKDWSLEGFSSQDFQGLERQFRSYYMV